MYEKVFEFYFVGGVGGKYYDVNYTLLFEFEFVQWFFIRQLLIYLLIGFEAYVFGRVFIETLKLKGAN
ncbi:hypothetical protein [Myroides odoratus]|uniref:hypothetical protein n=1 Tax=Myroides odoratus TaxID=256 RepID=UPI0039AEA849